VSRTLLCCLAFVWALHVAAAPAFTVDSLMNGRVMVLGDSITQNGTWVSFLEYFLQKSAPSARFDIVSVGLASETVSGYSEPGHAGGAFPRPCLFERLGRALDLVKPKLVVACYGMNDGGYEPFSEERMHQYQAGITRLVEDCAAAGAQVVLVTPPVFDARKFQPIGLAKTYDETLGRFSAWLVKEPPPGVSGVIDLHSTMAALLAERCKQTPDFYFAGDGVHPNDLGHLVMAKSILDFLRVSMPGKDLDSALTAAQADPIFKLVAQRRAARSEAWLANIGYTRERHVIPGTGDLQKAEAMARDTQKRIDGLRTEQVLKPASQGP
jgi:lysophospholipase L1-like esterase